MSSLTRKHPSRSPNNGKARWQFPEATRFERASRWQSQAARMSQWQLGSARHKEVIRCRPAARHQAQDSRACESPQKKNTMKRRPQSKVLPWCARQPCLGALPPARKTEAPSARATTSACGAVARERRSPPPPSKRPRRPARPHVGGVDEPLATSRSQARKRATCLARQQSGDDPKSHTSAERPRVPERGWRSPRRWILQSRNRDDPSTLDRGAVTTGLAP